MNLRFQHSLCYRNMGFRKVGLGSLYILRFWVFKVTIHAVFNDKISIITDLRMSYL